MGLISWESTVGMAAKSYAGRNRAQAVLGWVELALIRRNRAHGARYSEF